MLGSLDPPHPNGHRGESAAVKQRGQTSWRVPGCTCDAGHPPLGVSTSQLQNLPSPWKGSRRRGSPQSETARNANATDTEQANAQETERDEETRNKKQDRQRNDKARNTVTKGNGEKRPGHKTKMATPRGAVGWAARSQWKGRRTLWRAPQEKKNKRSPRRTVKRRRRRKAMARIDVFRGGQ